MTKYAFATRVGYVPNNPRKVKALSSYGIAIAERVPLHVGRNPHNEHYLDTKQSKLGHWLETHQDDDPEV